jgi:hypothetical protein
MDVYRLLASGPDGDDLGPGLRLWQYISDIRERRKYHRKS